MDHERPFFFDSLQRALACFVPVYLSMLLEAPSRPKPKPQPQSRRLPGTLVKKCTTLGKCHCWCSKGCCADARVAMPCKGFIISRSFAVASGALIAGRVARKICTAVSSVIDVGQEGLHTRMLHSYVRKSHWVHRPKPHQERSSHSYPAECGYCCSTASTDSKTRW